MQSLLSVTPSRVCELKYFYSFPFLAYKVTPSRVCELKCGMFGRGMFGMGHTLTGVWVEISSGSGYWFTISIVTPSRVCELKLVCCIISIIHGMSHPHGCVSWNNHWLAFKNMPEIVTPSRVCELKSYFDGVIAGDNGHTLTGVWVEICILRHVSSGVQVTPSRVCELKCNGIYHCFIFYLSHPHGCVSWNWAAISANWR